MPQRPNTVQEVMKERDLKKQFPPITMDVAQDLVDYLLDQSPTNLDEINSAIDLFPLSENEKDELRIYARENTVSERQWPTAHPQSAVEDVTSRVTTMPPKARTGNSRLPRDLTKPLIVKIPQARMAIKPEALTSTTPTLLMPPPSAPPVCLVPDSSINTQGPVGTGSDNDSSPIEAPSIPPATSLCPL